MIKKEAKLSGSSVTLGGQAASLIKKEAKLSGSSVTLGGQAASLIKKEAKHKGSSVTQGPILVVLLCNVVAIAGLTALYPKEPRGDEKWACHHDNKK